MGRNVLKFGETAHGFYNSGGKYKTRLSGKKTKECSLWENIRIRCQILPSYDEERFGKYSDKIVCENWKDFQKFAEWFNLVEYYEDGWQLDKDLLFKGNKVYCSETCVFLPEDVNKALNIRSRKRGELPLGICFANKERTYIDVQYSCIDPAFCVRKYLPASELLEAFSIYKTARESYIKSLAAKYRDRIDPRAYEALINYEVTIED